MRAALFAVAAALAAVAARSQPPAASAQPPVLIHKTAPEYTPAARKRGIEGAVRLYVRIGTDGRAHRVRVMQGLGYGLDEKAVEAVRQWRFLPGTRDGVPVVVPAEVEVTFRLRGYQASFRDPTQYVIRCAARWRPPMRRPRSAPPFVPA